MSNFTQGDHVVFKDKHKGTVWIVADALGYLGSTHVVQVAYLCGPKPNAPAFDPDGIYTFSAHLLRAVSPLEAIAFQSDE